ncbi:MAG: Glycosyltransferase, group 2 family protein [Candidatus Magasanikbacteria bacterium GW2011_GWC2_41_17]|uniref:Glycosyltransferase, group 2 family protein n=2 Tax=Candidatus Magasanikiibacteriota TaxID=1752731 RepID=A0A0G0ZL33_9BACT|nr:MAG: Glycosyltransferase, group 2 family protein [Candidatus Magasanikbacteria bacterium GW2011_GWC2_41_17]KKS13668.1 MAG: Glycosyltransferase, group 2 family protein [Candidatus Magasanikbacteria bacterium GW2011_GWA2_41_55]
MDKIFCTVGILTFNSANTLRRALESIKDFAEIIVCDGGSADATLEIAKEYGCKIIFQNSQFKDPDNRIKDFAGARNQCLDEANFDWFLYIDSDEAISPGLKLEIEQIVASDVGAHIYNVPLGLWIHGKLMRYSSNYPGYQNRFFNKKSGARFFKTVHERIKFDESVNSVKCLKNPWYVFCTDEEADHYFRETRKYLKIEAQRYQNLPFIDSLRRCSRYLKNVLKIIIKSFRNYFLHGFRYSVPPQMEIGRALYQLAVVYILLINQVRRLFKF